ncbi:MAG: AAA family ATPase [Bacteroidales bacterium]|nr:AAA family ATPase [Bacteroidales bacterium]
MSTLEGKKVKYPVGEHSFRELRQEGYAYVDKTQLVHQLLNQGKFIFLSRPRRFGKSLLLSTVEAFYRGEKELFEGTWLGTHEKEWDQYPVLHFDMTETSGESAEEMKAFLLECFEIQERRFGVSINSHITDVGRRFKNLIWNINEKTGKQVL